MSTSYNLKSPAVKRLMREAEELRNATEEYYAQPLEDNLFEWHFTVRGPPKSDFDGGIYHGRITLPPDYPMKPPSIILLTPNGRFEINKKICLSISGHHPESWQPSWSIRTALLAIIGFMPTHGNGAIGSLDYSPEERQNLAKKSQKWCCLECGSVENLLAKSITSDSSVKSGTEKQISFYFKRTLNEESNTDIGTTHLQPIDIRPPFSFSSNVDNMLEVVQDSEPSNLTHRISRSEQSNLQSCTRQTISQPNGQENPPLLVEALNIGETQPQHFYRTLSTVCICVILLLLCILITRRLFFY